MKSKRVTKWLCVVLTVLILVALMPFRVLARSSDTPIKIGVLAKRGTEQCMEMWGPTAEYLTCEISEYSFEIVPVDFDDILATVERGEVDFIFANSSYYVKMEVKYGTSRIVTLKNLRPGGAYTVFGGLVLCRANRKDITDFSDLRGKSFASVDEHSLGGWRMVWRELKKAGIDPYRDFAELKFVGTHDAVIYEVRDGTVDAGSVRTDTLERMAAEGKISTTEYRVVGQRKTEGFPFLHSTRLYPEWPFAKVKHTSDDLAQKVAIALLRMPADSAAAKAGKCEGWTIPLNYQPVHECLKELRVGPYKDFGKFTLADAIKHHWHWLISIVILFVLMMITTARVITLNHRLKLSRSFLEKELVEREWLEEQLRLRTKELEEITIGLRQANIRLQELDKLKSMFIASMSHELRTPLNSIIGFTGIILHGMSGEVTDEQRKQLTMVKSSAAHLLDLINDVIDVSKIETNRVELAIEEFDLSALVQDVNKSFETSAEEQGLKITLEVPKKLMVTSDERRAKQIVINLVNNALKFTDKGKVQIKVWKMGKKAEVSVADTGIGIGKEDIGKLFQAFGRVTTENRLTEGSGLGLYLSKKIADLLGGDIKAESEFGKGSVFTFTLPLK